MDAISPEEFETEFRFGITELPLLLRALKIPAMFTCANGTVCSGTEGLLIVLKRFSYPCRLSDMIPRFGRSVPELSLILNEVISFIYTNHGYLLRDLDQPWLSSQHLEDFALAVHRKGAALENCWGFVDGTMSSPNLPPRREPACVEWAQKSTRPKVSISCCAKWFNSQFVWTSW